MADEPPSLDPRAQALFLDFDGTLVNLVDDPAGVAIDKPALERLEALEAEFGGALAIVSGRRVADIDRFLAPVRFPVAGVHGLERRFAPDGPVQTLAGPEALDEIRAALNRRLRDEPRIQLEDKGAALVLHYRSAPELETHAIAMMREASGERDDVTVMHGNRIVEVHPAGMDKGRAIAAMCETAPFAGRRPVYVGDDVTDEYAFRHVREAGGVSIKVGTGETAAEFRLCDVAAVHEWLGIS